MRALTRIFLVIADMPVEITNDWHLLTHTNTPAAPPLHRDLLVVLVCLLVLASFIQPQGVTLAIDAPRYKSQVHFCM